MATSALESKKPSNISRTNNVVLGHFCFLFQESPRQTKPKKGLKQKVHEFRPFLWILVFSLGKQARFTLNFCSGMPLWKVHELTFLWFGLPGPLLTFASWGLWVTGALQSCSNLKNVYMVLWEVPRISDLPVPQNLSCLLVRPAFRDTHIPATFPSWTGNLSHVCCKVLNIEASMKSELFRRRPVQIWLWLTGWGGHLKGFT